MKELLAQYEAVKSDTDLRRQLADLIVQQMLDPQPLTLEEVKERKGKPVYQLGIKNKSLTGWGLVSETATLIYDNNGDCWVIDDYGITYLSYDFPTTSK